MTPRSMLQFKLPRDRSNIPSWKDEYSPTILEGFSDHIVLHVISAPSSETQISGKEASLNMLLRSPALQWELLWLLLTLQLSYFSYSLAQVEKHTQVRLLSMKLLCYRNKNTSKENCLCFTAEEIFCPGGLQKKTGRLILLTCTKFRSCLKLIFELINSVIFNASSVRTTV